MTADEALQFLQEHQPMPEDGDITDAEGDMFMQIIKHFEMNPDTRCLPLLVGSVSSETSLGMYEQIRFALMAHDQAAVVPILRDGLRRGSEGTKYRCCSWAADVSGWELEEDIAPLIYFGGTEEYIEEDIRGAAASFLELKALLGSAQKSSPRPVVT